VSRAASARGAAGDRAARAVFIDKDGTLVENVPYNVDPARILMCRSVPQGLRLLSEAGFRLIVVSNQSGVALGFFTEEALGPVESKLKELMAYGGVALDGFYYCPHSPVATRAEYALRCDCRKPRPGMLRRAAAEHGIDLAASWMIGDILDDVEAGNRAGCRSVLIDNGNETLWDLSGQRRPDYTARDFGDAARHIVGFERAREVA
jgi:histidinol-phosphate phosphatase family protein